MKSIFTYIKNDQLEELKKLANSNSKVLEQRDIQKNTPFLLAVKLNKKQIINYLLKQKININAQNNIGLTPLIYTAKNNESSLMKKLLAKGASLKLKSINDIEALGYAIKYQNYSIFHLLIKLTNKNKKYTNKQELLVKACFDGKISPLKKLLTNDIDINFRYYLGFTLLMFAANSGNQPIVEYLIKNGANVNQKNNMNDTALRMATVTNLRTVKILIKHGAKINHLTKNGFSPLLSAVFFEKTTIIKLLLKEGANPKLTGTNNRLAYLQKIKNNKKVSELLKTLDINK